MSGPAGDPAPPPVPSSGPSSGPPPGDDRPGRAARWWRPALLLAIFVATAVVAVSVGVPPVDEVRAWIAGAGWAGPLLWAVLYAGLSLTPVPVSLLAVAGGVLFGLGPGLPATLAGKLVGAAVGFALARRLGRGSVVRSLDGRTGRGAARLAALDDLVRRRGVIAVIGVRLAPVLPFSLMNMAWGLTAVRQRDYMVGTIVGAFPGTAALVAVGAYGADPGSLPFLLSLGGLGVLGLIGVVLARRRLRTEPSLAGGTATPAPTATSPGTSTGRGSPDDG
ncbi:MAG: TVP38/TMEM64 family protein [Pseudonocardia sediminis]